MSVGRHTQDFITLLSRSQPPPLKVTTTTRALNGEPPIVTIYRITIYSNTCIILYVLIWSSRYQSLFLEYQPESAVTTYQFH